VLCPDKKNSNREVLLLFFLEATGLVSRSDTKKERKRRFLAALQRRSPAAPKGKAL
jgi:hypothetical protein